MSLQQSFLSKYKPNQALQPTAPLRYALMLILASVIQRAATCACQSRGSLFSLGAPLENFELPLAALAVKNILQLDATKRFLLSSD